MAHATNFGAQTRALTVGEGFFARLNKMIADYRLYQATIAELAQLSDRDLSDLGIHRASIRDIAHESVYGA